MTITPAAARSVSRLVAVVIAALLIAASWLKPLDQAAEATLSAGLKGALASFAVVKSLDAAVSIAQGSTLSLNGLVGGATLAAGQILDPANDLLERVSGLILAACASFGIQLLLLKLGGTGAVSVALTLVLVAAAWRWWAACALPRWLSTLAVLMIVVRFAVPAATAITDLAYRHTMEQEQAQASERLKALAREVSFAATPSTGLDPTGTAAEAKPPSGSVIDGIKALAKGGERGGEPRAGLIDQAKAKARALVEKIDAAAEDLMRLVAIAFVHTILLPVLLMFALVRLASALFAQR